MLARFIFILLFTTISHLLDACQCAKGIGRNFLSNINRFDVVVLGTFNSTDHELRLKVSKVYKGEILSKEIKLLMGGTDCYHSLHFKLGTQLILGLVKSPYSGERNAYMAFGCTTSAVLMDQDTAFTPERQLPMFKKPRIGKFNSKMSLKKLERKIKNRN